MLRAQQLLLSTLWESIRHALPTAKSRPSMSSFTTPSKSPSRVSAERIVKLMDALRRSLSDMTGLLLAADVHDGRRLASGSSSAVAPRPALACAPSEGAPPRCAVRAAAAIKRDRGGATSTRFSAWLSALGRRG